MKQWYPIGLEKAKWTIHYKVFGEEEEHTIDLEDLLEKIADGSHSVNFAGKILSVGKLLPGQSPFNISLFLLIFVFLFRKIGTE